MGRRLFLTVSESPEIAHGSYPAPWRVPGHHFFQCFMKPFVNQGSLFFLEIPKRLCLKAGFLACLC